MIRAVASISGARRYFQGDLSDVIDYQAAESYLADHRYPRSRAPGRRCRCGKNGDASSGTAAQRGETDRRVIPDAASGDDADEVRTAEEAEGDDDADAGPGDQRA